MKNILIKIAILLTISLSMAHMLSQSGATASNGDWRDSEGTLNFSVRTATYNGPYAPKNAGAIWITNAQNQFVKTIKVWANQYRYTLVRWNASSGGNTSGAITGASLNNHILHNVTWNGSNVQGAQVPDGEYKINVEFTEHNASAANLGKYKQVTFVKGPNPVDTTFPNETWFRDMTLVWTPVIQNGTLFGVVTTLSGNPIPGGQVTAGQYSAVTGLDGTYSLSMPVGNWDVVCTAGGYVSQTSTGVVVGPGEYVERNFTLGTVANTDELNPGAALRVLALGPNPFQETVRIRFEAVSKQQVRLAVYDLKGRKLEEQELTPDHTGSGDYVWDGRDAKGARCAAGIYLLKLSQGGSVITRKLSLTR